MEKLSFDVWIVKGGKCKLLANARGKLSRRSASGYRKEDVESQIRRDKKSQHEHRRVEH
jgi:hypothetical protein